MAVGARNEVNTAGNAATMQRLNETVAINAQTLYVKS